MNRGDSPMQAKAKRRQSDAKWRASVATCYDTLKYVVPNVKNMTKRKVSKALILQESEKHIKELEAAVIHLLETESKKNGKAVFWEEDSVWSPCTLEKLRQDFAQKQQNIFHMAVNGRRCYNLLQDIKEEVFAMEAEPSRLAVLDEHSQAMSSLLAKLHTLKASHSFREGAHPIQRINLVVTGAGTGSQQKKGAEILQNQNQMEKKVLHSKDTISPQAAIKVTPKACHALESTPVLPKAHPISHCDDKLSTSFSDISTGFSSEIKNFSPKSEKGDCKKITGIPAKPGGSSKAFATYNLSNNQFNSSSSKSHSQQNSVKESFHGNLQLKASSSSAIENTRRLKIHIEYVNGNFYLVSGNKNSTIHLIKTSSSATVGARSMQSKQCAAMEENEQEQEVPSMKLPLKRPVEDEQVESSNSLHHTALTGIKKLSTDANCIKQEIQAPYATTSNVCSMSDVHSETDFCSDQKCKMGLFTVSVSSAHTQKKTLNQAEKSLPNSYDIKEEIVETHTPQNTQDPLLSSLAISKPDDSTPLFMRTENDMVIKRPPKLGTARKKLNFGVSYSTTPDKHDSLNSAGKACFSAGGFTPVKLPNEFGMVPDEDGNSMGSLISPWKIVDSPSYAQHISSQNCMASSPMLDLDNSLMCLETIDTMDLDKELDYKPDKVHRIADKATSYGEKTIKRKVSIETPEGCFRHQPKCRRKLEKFYGGTTPLDLEKQDINAISPDYQSVPDIYKFDNENTLKSETPVDHFDYIQNYEKKLRQSSFKDTKELSDQLEENHVVPDSYTKSNRCENKSYDLPRLLCVEPSPSPGNCIFYSSNACDDFDGYYYYYRLMSHQLRQVGSSPANDTNSQETSRTELTSPAVASKIAHMWSCLPPHDKLTMATLASLEQRQSDRSSDSPSFESHQQDISQHQMFGFQENKFKVKQACNSSIPSYEDTFQEKLKLIPLLDFPYIDIGWLDNPSLANEREKSEDGQCKSSDAPNGLQVIRAKEQQLQSEQDNVSICRDLENLEEINVAKCLQSLQDDLKVPKIELEEGTHPEAYDMFKAEDALMLGELSPDLQEVEVLPLFDHTYD